MREAHRARALAHHQIGQQCHNCTVERALPGTHPVCADSHVSQFRRVPGCLPQCGTQMSAVAEYTPLDRVNAQAQPQAEPQQLPAAVQHVIADEDRVTRKHEKMRMRLEAEASLGVQAALIGSFALTMLPEAKEMEHARQWLFVCSMAAAGVLCLLCVITSGTIYWAGLHLLSATKNTIQEEVDMFRLFWKASVSKLGPPSRRCW